MMEVTDTAPCVLCSPPALGRHSDNKDSRRLVTTIVWNYDKVDIYSSHPASRFYHDAFPTLCGTISQRSWELPQPVRTTKHPVR